MTRKILVVEDDRNILHIEKDYLEANGFSVTAVTDGTEGLSLALAGGFNLIILDIMLPNVDGLEICRQVRRASNVPILLVSAKKDDLDKIRGLGFGADDYVVKPFSPSELVARVIAHINRYERLTTTHEDLSTNIIEFDSLKIDKSGRRVYVNGNEITFTNKEFELITYLAESPDKVFSKEELLKIVWGYDSMGDTSTVTVHVNRIRDKLFAQDKNFQYVNTVWGKGYRFKK